MFEVIWGSSTRSKWESVGNKGKVEWNSIDWGVEDEAMGKR
jgi:hypothetical protein